MTGEKQTFQHLRLDDGERSQHELSVFVIKRLVQQFEDPSAVTPDVFGSFVEQYESQHAYRVPSRWAELAYEDFKFLGDVHWGELRHWSNRERDLQRKIDFLLRR